MPKVKKKKSQPEERLEATTETMDEPMHTPSSQDVVEIQMSGSDYDIMMSLLSFGLRTLSAIIKEETDKGNHEVSEKHDGTLKKYIEIFNKLEDASDENLGKDRILH